MSYPHLFLEPTDHNTYVVVDIAGNIISENTMPDDAIRTARQKGHQENIEFGSGLAMHETPEDIYTAEQLISELTFKCNLRAIHVYDDNMNFKGYTLEARE